MIIVRSHIKSSEKRFKSMKIKKLDRRKDQILRDVFKNSCSKNLTSLLQTRSIAVKTVKKILEAYLGLCQTAMTELFCENS